MYYKFFIGIFFLLFLNSCTVGLRKAENPKEYEKLVTEWLGWKHGKLKYEGYDLEGMLRLNLSYDSNGYLEKCEITDLKNIENKPKIEKEFCKALGNIVFKNAKERKINLNYLIPPPN